MQVIDRTGGHVVARDEPGDGMTPPPGDELFRFATVSDTHIGMEDFGFLPTVRDPAGSAPPPEQCLRAALREAAAWGAQLIVHKGDVTQHGTREEAARAVELLAACGVPVDAVVGNHEVKPSGESLADLFLDRGIELVQDGVAVRDVPGLRLVRFDSTIPGRHVGSYARFADDVVDAVAEAHGAAIVLTHHQPQPLPIPHHWPPGIPSGEARALFDRLLAVNRHVWLTAGHTHRHRARRHASLVITEVGSTHDYPGTWAGYAVHEGGLRQVVRRIADPDALAWNEATRRTVLGAWGRWSPGRISDRCVSHTW